MDILEMELFTVINNSTDFFFWCVLFRVWVDKNEFGTIERKTRKMKSFIQWANKNWFHVNFSIGFMS